MSSHPDYKRVSVLREALGPFKRRFTWAGAYFGVIVLIGMHSLAEAKIPQRTGLIVMALHRGGLAGPATHNPGPETILQSEDVLIVLGRQDQIQKLREYVERGQP